MKLNNIQLSVVLWLGAEVISILLTLCHRIKARLRFKWAKLYFGRLLFMAEKGTSYDKMLEEMYVSLGTNKGLKKLIFKALFYQDTEKAFDYMDRKLQCPAISHLQNCLTRNLGAVDLQIFRNEFSEWIEISQKYQKLLHTNRLKLFVEETVLLVANMALYFRVKSETSLLIFIVVNTIGVIIFIVLEYDCMAENYKKRERNLASIIATKKTLARAVKLKNLYQFTAGLGLIINVSQIAVQILEQVV